MAEKSLKMLYEEQKNKPTAAQMFISDIATLTHRSENTVRMWLSGRQEPDELAKNVIAEKYQVSVTSLFPEETQIAQV